MATYREHNGEDWVQGERLKHFNGIYELEPEGESAKKLRGEYVLALLDEGEAAQARKVLEAMPEDSQKRAVFAWSIALVEFVAWKGDEEGASEQLCSDKVRQALAANVYIGIFLADLDCYTREIDPTGAPSISGRTAGSVEEALAYTSIAAGCWMDFNGDGAVSMLVGAALEEMDAEIAWPPVSEGKSERYLRQFMDATAIAEKEADEAEEEERDGEEGEKGTDDHKANEQGAEGRKQKRLKR